MSRKNYFIRKNTPELRNKLENLGCNICPCCTFENAVWLNTYYSLNEPLSIHGVGYWDETCYFDTVEGALANFLLETDSTDCLEDERLFLEKVTELLKL